MPSGKDIGEIMKDKKLEKMFTFITIAIIVVAGGYYILNDHNTNLGSKNQNPPLNNGNQWSQIISKCNFTLVANKTFCIKQGVNKSKAFSFCMPQGVKGIMFNTNYNKTGLNECIGPAQNPNEFSPCLPYGQTGHGGVFLTSTPGIWYFGYYGVTGTGFINVKIYYSLTFTGMHA